MPIILYSVQGRTGINIEPATVVRLAAIRNIVGIKEASGSIAQMAAILNSVPEDFVVLSGDDAITLPLIALGGRGVISVVSNEIPAEMSEMVRLALRGNIWGAREIHRRFHPVNGSEFCGVESWASENGDGRDGIAGAGVALAVGGAEARELRANRGSVEFARAC